MTAFDVTVIAPHTRRIDSESTADAASRAQLWAQALGGQVHSVIREGAEIGRVASNSPDKPRPPFGRPNGGGTQGGGQIRLAPDPLSDAIAVAA